MKDSFYANTHVIVKGVKIPSEQWNETTRDAVGEGTQRDEWLLICEERGIANRVTFHSFSDDVEYFMAHTSCLLFLSYNERMPLTLEQAVLIGTPILANALCLKRVIRLARNEKDAFSPWAVASLCLLDEILTYGTNVDIFLGRRDISVLVWCFFGLIATLNRPVKFAVPQDHGSRMKSKRGAS